VQLFAASAMAKASLSSLIFYVGKPLRRVLSSLCGKVCRPWRIHFFLEPERRPYIGMKSRRYRIFSSNAGNQPRNTRNSPLGPLKTTDNAIYSIFIFFLQKTQNKYRNYLLIHNKKTNKNKKIANNI